MAAILKTSPAWLQYGVSESAHAQRKSESKNISKRIPLLSWNDTTQLMHPAKISTSEHKEYLPDFYTDKTHWYALRVKGDSMTAPHGNVKSFHEGDIIIVDPEKKATHGSFVVALPKRSKEATFKQYVVDGGIEYLKPLNPQYPIVKMDESTHVCGVVLRLIFSI